MLLRLSHLIVLPAILFIATTPGFASVATVLICGDGLLVAADKRVNQVDSGGQVTQSRDDYTKIHRLNNHCVFVITGQPSNDYGIINGKDRRLDFEQLTYEHFKSKAEWNSLCEPGVYGAFKQYLNQEVSDVLDVVPPERWLSKWRPSSDGVMCTISVCNFNSKNRQFEFVYFVISVDPKERKHDVEPKRKALTTDGRDTGSPGMIVLGKDDTFKDLMVRPSAHPNDKYCQFMNSRPSPKIRDLSKSKAIEFCLEMIRLTHEAFREEVGDTADVFVLSSSGEKQVLWAANVYQIPKALKSLKENSIVHFGGNIDRSLHMCTPGHRAIRSSQMRHTNGNNRNSNLRKEQAAKPEETSEQHPRNP